MSFCGCDATSVRMTALGPAGDLDQRPVLAQYPVVHRKPNILLTIFVHDRPTAGTQLLDPDILYCKSFAFA
jgi:hypothetical protein